MTSELRKLLVKYLSGLDESVVAFVMSKLVVDLLHAVEVDEEEQQALVLAASEIEIRRSLFEQAATIEQAGEIVFEECCGVSLRSSCVR